MALSLFNHPFYGHSFCPSMKHGSNFHHEILCCFGADHHYRPFLQRGRARSSLYSRVRVLGTTFCNREDTRSLSCSGGRFCGGARRLLAKASPGWKSVIIRSPTVAETAANHSTGPGGTAVTENSAVFSTLDEAPGSRASYNSESESEGSAEYSLVFDNETFPGATLVGVDGMDQDNLLMDVTLSFYEMGISVQSAQLLTRNNRIIDQFLVSDAETREAIPEERWSDIKEKIFAKLKRRNVLNTASGDPTLVEQVTFLIQTLDNAVRGDGKEDVLEAVWASKNVTPLWYASFDHSLRSFKKGNVAASELQELFNRTEVKILRRTDEMRATKPTVLEEIVTGLDYFRYSLFEALCTIYRYAENSVNADPGYKVGLMADFSIQMNQSDHAASNDQVVGGPNSNPSKFMMKLRREKPLAQKMLAEVISTFILIFAGCGSIVVNQMTDGKVTDSGVNLIFGLVVAAMVYSVGHISDCHMNPAITIGFAFLKKCTLLEVPLFIISECIGATLAMFMLKGILQPTNAQLVKACTQPFDSVLQSFLLEVVITFILMFVVSAIATDTRAHGHLAGIVVGAVVCLLSYFAGPISGCSMNPARSLGPAIASGNYNALWVYIVAPPIGAIIGLFAYNCLRTTEIEEKKDVDQ